MEQTENGSSSGSYDKSKVLDVKPLRCLVPWFPAPPLGNQTPPPFVQAPPFGPFPPGYSPFYPFFNPQYPNGTTNNPTSSSPSFRMPPPPLPQLDAENGDAGPSRRNHDSGIISNLSSARSESEEYGQSNGRKRTASIDLEDTPFNGKKPKSSKTQTKVNLNGPNPDIKFLIPATGNKESVTDLLLKFDALRRRFAQIEDTKERKKGVKRADLKAGTLMFENDLRTNAAKRIGNVPGVEIGDVFFFRIEMCLVGLHAPIMAGIDYMSVKFDQEEESLALSIVSSGGYEDDAENGDVLIYSGQGGAANKREGKEAADQKLERGNLALENSLRRDTEVRVIRGLKDAGNPNSKVYIYDGLYRIHESWIEKGKAGCNVFKYKLTRIPGQPDAFVTWKSIQLWKDNTISRPGMILPDLTSGAEKLPICLVNDVDGEKGPSHFTYFRGIKYAKPVNSMTPSIGCNCRSSCAPGDPNCACVRKNDGDLPYITNGILVIRKPFVHECGPSCLCYPNCKNQVSQSGLKVRFEVFKTKDKGWGLRSWDPIRAGMFICEYAGQVIEKSELNEVEDEEDEYVFNAARSYNKEFKWNYIPELLGEDGISEQDEVPESPLSLVISAKKFGNVARFMNHSCSPNVFWQPVLYDHNDVSSPHIVFYAIKHIPPMTELTFDYGPSDGGSSSVHGRRKACLCKSPKCRGFFG